MNNTIMKMICNMILRRKVAVDTVSDRDVVVVGGGVGKCVVLLHHHCRLSVCFFRNVVLVWLDVDGCVST